MADEKTFTHVLAPNRRELPIHTPEYVPIGSRYLDCAPDPPPRFEVHPPEGAPNILLVMLDDMGFGTSQTFGGPIPMPSADRIAAMGRKMNHFHTTAVCSPTRAALLTGYNHHSTNMGSVAEFCTAYPGNSSSRPRTITPLARTLRENGYSTAMFGKSHEIPAWETGPTGPFDHWPLNSGFEKFYGFLGAETNQFSPVLYDGFTQLPTPTDPSYHLSEDLARHCSQWIQMQQSLTPDKPFFAYLAPGATHSPHQVPASFIRKFRGQFDDGWDKLRERTFLQMKAEGIIPQHTQLAPKPEGIGDWDDLTETQKAICSRQMEVYAGFANHTDEQVGRVLDTLDELGITDNTLVIYILGDNGASAEGGPTGSHNEFSSFNRVTETEDYQAEHLDELGSPKSYGHFAAGWAVALDTPFTWMKGIASDFGGTRNGMVASYPRGFGSGSAVCSQFHHVIDVAPTILELCGIPAPATVDGVVQKPMEGISMLYALQNPSAAGRRRTQYFRIMGHYAIYHEGWMAGVIGPNRWTKTNTSQSADQQVWELYCVDNDFSCAQNLAAIHPERLKTLKDKFFEEAYKYNALPLDPRGSELFNPKIAGRPSVIGDRHELTLHAGMTGIREDSFPSTKNRSFSIEAEIETVPGQSDGVILSMGGRFGGYALYVKEGLLTFCYNWIGREKTYIKSGKKLPASRSQVRMDFHYDGGGVGKGGMAVLTINQSEVARGRIPRTIPYIICSSETVSVGLQRSTPVADEYTLADSEFAGDIYRVIVKAEPEAQ